MKAAGTAVRVTGLRKSYGSHEALRGIDFEIAAGEVFGLLGPNGAGKTTTIEILEGYRKRDAGEVEVLGEDPQQADRRLARAGRRRAPVLVALPEPDGAREPRRSSPATTTSPRDADEVIEIVGLAEKADARCRTLSGGQKRRLDLGLGADRQPGAALPRRADHRLRPGRAPRGVGDDPEPPLARHDDPAHDALPRRGRAALRPRRRAARRADRPRRHPGGADRRERADRDPLPPGRRARRRARPPSRPAACTS